MIYDFIIIGDGSAGLGAFLALENNNKKTLILTVGKEIDDATEKKIKFILDKDKNLKERNSVERIKRLSSNKFFPKKTQFGSDHMYENIVNNNLINLNSSYASGGLTSIWGASVLPYTKMQIRDWEINYHELKESYKFVERKFHKYFSNSNDEIKKIYKLDYKNNFFYKKERSKIIYKNYLKNKKFIKKKNISIGFSRLMIDKNCIGCGLCLYGCPYNYIFNTNHYLKRKTTNFQLKKNIKVIKFIEEKEKIKIRCLDLTNNKKINFFCKKLILASGVIETAKIIFKSTNKINKCVIKETQFINYPILNFSKKKVEKSHSLSDIYINYNSSKNIKNNFFIQIYEMNDYFKKFILEKIKMNFFKKFSNFLFNKLMIGNIYLDSEASDSVIMKKKRGKLKFKLVKNISKKNVIKNLFKKIKDIDSSLKIKSLSFFKIVHKFGESHHLGCSFPHDKNNINRTDEFGRLKYFKNVHIVDASTFKSIPPNTITLTIIANAYRLTKKILLDESYYNRL